MKKEYYAVAKGRKPGIYRTWPECREQVDKFSGAVYKGFKDKQSAEEFMQAGAYSVKQAAPKNHKPQRVNSDYSPNPAGLKHLYTSNIPPWEFQTFIGCHPDNLRIEALKLLNEAQENESIL